MSALPTYPHRHSSNLGGQSAEEIRPKLARALSEWEDAMTRYSELNEDLKRRHPDPAAQATRKRDMYVFKDAIEAFEFATTRVHVYAEALRQAEDRARRAAVAGSRPRRTVDNGAGYVGRRAS